MAKTKNKTKLFRGFDSSVKKVYDIEVCGVLMIKDFFEGNLGKMMLDEDVIFQTGENKLDLDTYV